MQVEMNDLSPESRVWYFPLSRPLSLSEIAKFTAGLSQFLESWVAHRVPVRSAAEIIAQQVVVVGADPSAVAVSGCAIDSLFRAVKSLAATFDVQLLDEGHVFFRKAGDLMALTRSDFALLCREGQVSPRTEMLDFTISGIEEHRRGEWRRPFSVSWHSRVFSFPAYAAVAS